MVVVIATDEGMPAVRPNPSAVAGSVVSSLIVGGGQPLHPRARVRIRMRGSLGGVAWRHNSTGVNGFDNVC